MNLKFAGKVKNRNTIILCFIITTLFLPVVLSAQNLLSSPQKIVIDKKRNRYIVSNFNGGDLVQIDSAGNQSYFVENAGMIDGMEIVGDTVYGSSYGGTVRGFNLENGEQVMNLGISGVEHLSSFVLDSSGNLYATDRFGTKIININVCDHSYSILVDVPEINLPNGILYEQENERLVFVSDKPNPPIQAVSLIDTSVTTLATTQLEGADGIVKDSNGFYYITGYELSGIYQFNSAFNQTPGIYFEGTTIIYPTYNRVQNSLLFTYYNQNSWGEISVDILLIRIIIKGENNSTSIENNGGTLQMHADVAPLNAADTTVTWSIEDGTATAFISQTGLLHATGTTEGNGTVTVVATANDASGVIGTKEITISNQNITVTDIIVTAENGDTVMDENQSPLQMFAEVIPDSATVQTVTWSIIENVNVVASISDSGLLQVEVPGDENGTVTVKAAANDGSGIWGSQTITILNPTKNDASFEKSNIKIWTNPGSDYIYIENPESHLRNFLIRIFDINGKIVYNKCFDRIELERINHLSFSPGLYFIMLQQAGFTQTEKIVLN